MNWYERFYPYWTNGTLGQSDGDTGDSSQRLATFWILMSVLGYKSKVHYEETISKHEIVSGRYRRSPILSYWGSDPTNFSRDQHSIMILAFGMLDDKKRIKESLWAIAKRFGFHQNFLRGTDDPTKYWKIPDVVTPAELASFIRGLDLYVLYPFLWILDLFFFPDFYFRKLHKWDADNMLCSHLIFANEKMPTLWSRIAFHCYYFTDFRARLWNYHCTNNGIKPLYDLFIYVYDHLRGRYEAGFIDRIIIRIIKLCIKSNSKEL